MNSKTKNIDVLILARLYSYDNIILTKSNNNANPTKVQMFGIITKNSINAITNNKHPSSIKNFSFN